MSVSSIGDAALVLQTNFQLELSQSNFRMEGLGLEVTLTSGHFMSFFLFY